MKTARRINAAKPRELVIALHCSGSGSSQWNRLADLLGDGYQLLAPEHYGCESAGPWSGERPFTLADEAERTIALIGRLTTTTKCSKVVGQEQADQ